MKTTRIKEKKEQRLGEGRKILTSKAYRQQQQSNGGSGTAVTVEATARISAAAAEQRRRRNSSDGGENGEDPGERKEKIPADGNGNGNGNSGTRDFGKLIRARPLLIRARPFEIPSENLNLKLFSRSTLFLLFLPLLPSSSSSLCC